MQQIYNETWNKNEILAWSYTTLTQTIIQIQMTSYPCLGIVADYTLVNRASIEYDHITVADPDRQITGGGHPDPEIEGGGGLKKSFLRPFGPQFGLKIRGSRALRPH